MDCYGAAGLMNIQCDHQPGGRIFGGSHSGYLRDSQMGGLTPGARFALWFAGFSLLSARTWDVLTPAGCVQGDASKLSLFGRLIREYQMPVSEHMK